MGQFELFLNAGAVKYLELSVTENTRVEAAKGLSQPNPSSNIHMREIPPTAVGGSFKSNLQKDRLIIPTRAARRRSSSLISILTTTFKFPSRALRAQFCVMPSLG